MSGIASTIDKFIGRMVCLASVVLLAMALACGGGGSSEGAPQTPPVTTTAPAPPTGLTATAGDGQVSLTWTASATATGYFVLRGSAAGGPYTKVFTTAIPGTTYTNTGLTNNTPYFYVVTASNSAGESGNSNEVSATPVAATVSISISPDSTVLQPSGTFTFTATVTGTTNTAVTWSVEETDGGSINASGKYTAPAMEGTYHVIATSAEDATKTGSATVHVSSSIIIPPERTTAWNPGLNAVGGIPKRDQPSDIYQTLQPSGGDDTVAIQTALKNCPEGKVVKLGPGTFLIGRSPETEQGLEITRSNITLRGSGPEQTKLIQKTGSVYPVIIIGWRWVKHTVSRPLTSDGVKGSHSITISDAAGLKAGEIITLNQLSDDALRNDATAPVRKVYWGPNATDPDGGERRWFCQQNRPIGQTLEIDTITGNQLTFTTPLHIDFETALDAHVSRFTGVGGDDGWSGEWNSQDWLLDAVKYSGIEDLAVSNGGGGDGGGGIHLWACAYCWVKNVDSSLSEGHSCNVEGSFRCEVRDSYFHDTQNPNPGGGGYGIGLNVYSSDCLYENNIVWNFNKMTVCRASGGGNVFGYNYLQDGYGSTYREIVEIGAGPNHYAGNHMELFEGNECFNLGSESYWGNAIFTTYFRNHATSLRVSAPPLELLDVGNRLAVLASEGAWWYSYAGNVLGYDNMPLLGTGSDFHGNTFDQRTFAYEVDENNIGDWDASDHPLVPMWVIGVVDGPSFDPIVRSRTLRHGNYDYVTNGTVWESGLSQELPASLYLKAKPAFFGSETWPWVDGGNATIPIPGNLPAKLRFNTIHNLRLSQQ